MVRPTPQGVNSTTFHAAPFEHGLSVAGLYEYHAKNSPKHAAFTYADLETKESHDVLFADAWQNIRKVANIVLEHYSKTAHHAQYVADPKKRPIIGILALSDSLSSIYLTVAIMSLGFIAFPLSPRNNPTVTAHLLEKIGVHLLFVSENPATETLAREANDMLRGRGVSPVQTVPMVRSLYLADKDAGDTLKDGIVDIADTDVTIIMHSSGTTAFPKPIPITRRGLVNLSNIPCFGEVDLAGKRIAAHTNSIFHAMGLATIMWPLTSGATFALYQPTLAPIVPTPANFLESWVADRCNIIFCIPVFIEAWARNPENIATLKALDCIVFSGASVNQHIGDMLAQQGVVMHPFWGSTEVGPATMYIPRDAPPPHEWDYFKISKHVTFHMQPQENTERLYEPIMLATETCFPHVFNAELDGKPVYAVGDLLEQHPTDPERWKVYGRKDDQIMLSTSENVNPLPIEGTLVHDKNIAAAVMFGRGHIETGVIIQPGADIELPAEDEKKREEYIDLIWPTIEKANRAAPKYAEISRKRIVLTIPSKPFEYTLKGTPRRPVCLKLYAAEIEAVYKDEQDASLAADRQFPDRM